MLWSPECQNPIAALAITPLGQILMLDTMALAEGASRHKHRNTLSAQAGGHTSMITGKNCPIDVIPGHAVEKNNSTKTNVEMAGPQLGVIPILPYGGRIQPRRTLAAYENRVGSSYSECLVFSLVSACLLECRVVQEKFGFKISWRLCMRVCEWPIWEERNDRVRDFLCTLFLS